MPAFRLVGPVHSSNNLNRCAETGRAYGGFRDWNRELNAIAQAKTRIRQSTR